MTNRSVLCRFEEGRVDVDGYFLGGGLFDKDFSIYLDCIDKMNE